MIVLDQHLSARDFFQIVFGKEPVKIGDSAMQRMRDSFEFLETSRKDRVIYGINTGFGPMAQYKVSEEDQINMQYNLIRSHSAGSGRELEPVLVKAIMLVRLNSFIQGYSGISEEVGSLLCEMINHDICPVIYEHGGVGASGDLVQLAHLGLTLIGEGSVHYKGQKYETQEVFRMLDLNPITIRIREGLSIANGTSAMTGIGLVNTLHSHNLLHWSLVASSMLLEIVEAFDDSFSAELNRVKLHTGQQAIAATLRDMLRGSKRIKQRETFEFLHGDNRIFTEKVQEYYSIRCLPQILGPIHDTLHAAEQVVRDEMNSVSDNPIIDAKSKTIYHGGNFHGDYVSLEMDKIKVAVTKLSILAERQLNFLLNDNLNQILPPFLNLGKLGVNLGMQGAQFVATSTVAENVTLSNPMYVHSVPCNKDNQDVVSMGANAALMAHKVINNTYEVLAIELITCLQAIDHLKIHSKLSDTTRNAYEALRSLVPMFEDDKPLYIPIGQVKTYLSHTFGELPTKPVKNDVYVAHCD